MDLHFHRLTDSVIQSDLQYCDRIQTKQLEPWMSRSQHYGTSRLGGFVTKRYKHCDLMSRSRTETKTLQIIYFYFCSHSKIPLTLFSWMHAFIAIIHISYC